MAIGERVGRRVDLLQCAIRISWNDPIKDRRVYWVEAMSGYSLQAHRFLITDRDLEDLKYVQSYNPENDDGPLQLRDKRLVL